MKPLFRRKKTTRVWQKILGLHEGDRVKVTKAFNYFSPKLRRYKSYMTSGFIKQGTIGKVIQIKDCNSKYDPRLYRIQFPDIKVWCSDANLELILDD